MTETGYFALRTAADLFRKLKHDYERLEANPVDSYAAFDFFVTAFHIEAWVKAGGGTIKDRSPNELAMWEVCSQLANGLKHFGAARNNRVLRDARHEGGAFQADAFQANPFQVGRLEVELEGFAREELGDVIAVVSLGKGVLAYWEKEFSEAK